MHQTMISLMLRPRISVLIKKRRKASQMDSEDQEKRTSKNCCKLILNGCDIVLDDEKHFGLSENNVQYNQRCYTTDPSQTPSDIKY